LATIINDLDDWEKVVEEFELCGGVITESDRRAVLLKKLLPGVYSSLVSSLRRCRTYRDMKSELRDEITFMKDWGLNGKSGRAHLASEQVPAQEALAAAEAEGEKDEEGVITLDLSGVSEEQADVLVAAARSSGLRVRPPFRTAGRKPFPKAKAKARPGTPPPAREAKSANCGEAHATRDCRKPMKPECEQDCFNCGKPGHRTKDCKLPDKRKLGNGGRALTMSDGQRDVFMGVVTHDVPVPLASSPLRQPGAQARRKQAAKQSIGVIRLKACNDSACTIAHNPENTHNIPPIAQYDMYP
jgi:hypothetical protein